jgi:cyclase
MGKISISIWPLVGQFLLGTALSAEEIVLETVHVSGSVYCIYGQGGNTAVLKTDEGLLVVDSKYESVADDLIEAIRAISTTPIEYLINTHYHGDHTGANAVIGANAEIVMHPACKATKQELMRWAGMEEGYLATVKVWSEGMVISLGNETVRLLHFGRGHTSGDLVVVFETSRVVHTGDLFFNGRPPFMETGDKPDTDNWIRSIEAICGEYPDYSMIPGHGKVADAAAFLDLAGYLRILRENVAAAIHDGRTKEEAISAIDLAEYSLFDDPLDKRRERIKNNVACVYDELTLGARQ